MTNKTKTTLVLGTDVFLAACGKATVKKPGGYIRPVEKKWRLGPPPSIGWWPASVCRSPGTLRFWDGYRWSLGVVSTADSSQAAKFAEFQATEEDQREIKWTDRWWPEPTQEQSR